MNRLRRAIVLATFVWPFAAAAQQAKKVWRIGILAGAPQTNAPHEAFRQRLRELGYVEGRNLAIEWRPVEGRPERAPEFAAELVRLKVDCIAAGGVSSIRAAKQATASIPIVMTNVDADPVELGFVTSLARPGGNVTGFTGIAHDLAAKRIELLRELVPSVRRIGMIVNASTQGVVGDAQKAHYRGTEDAVKKLGIESRLFALKSIDELDGLFSRTTDWRPDALSFFSGSWFRSNRARIMDWVARMKLPAVYSNTEYVEYGGLMGYSDDELHRFREVADYVAKILSGVRAADLPVQQPTRFLLAVNVKTAKALGITIPQSILLRADRIIQ
jgi:putative ABC transport system substrate-binding protein